jgi:uncharacterized protein YkwD
VRLTVLVVASAAIALAGAAGPASASSCPNAVLVPTATTLGLAAVATICLLNEQRAVAVQLDMGLTAVGFAYARTMVTDDYFLHTSPDGGGLSDRLRQIGYSPEGAGENLYWGSGVLATPSAAVEGWMHSDEHRANMVDPSYRRIGVGVAMGAPIRDMQAAVTYVADFDPGASAGDGSSIPAPVAPPSASARHVSAVQASSALRRRTAARVKSAVRLWTEASRRGDAAGFCGQEDNKMLRARTGEINAAGIAACLAGFRANPALPPADELAVARVITAGTKASLTLTVRGHDALIGLRMRNGRWKIDTVQT